MQNKLMKRLFAKKFRQKLPCVNQGQLYKSGTSQ